MTLDTESVVFLHPSDEFYGADRMLLELLAALPPGVRAQVWLPTDLPHGPDPLCRMLAERGHTVRHVDLPILRRAYRTPASLARLTGRTQRLKRLLREAAPGIVYCTTSAAYLGIHAARASGVPMVLGHVQELWSRSDGLVLSRLARRCDRLVAISQAVADQLPPALQQRTTVVVNATTDPGPVERLKGRSGPLHYVVASRWNGWKGHATLLAAWERASCPGRLTVLGGAPRVGAVTDVVALVAALPDPGSVAIVGEVSDPSAYLTAADVVVVPSDDPEPFGLVAIEAFARGRPVVASAAGGLAEIVTPDVTGWLFPPRDADALAQVLRTLDRPTVEDAGDRARSSFERDYTVERYAQQWRDVVWPGAGS